MTNWRRDRFVVIVAIVALFLAACTSAAGPEADGSASDAPAVESTPQAASAEPAPVPSPTAEVVDQFLRFDGVDDYAVLQIGDPESEITIEAMVLSDDLASCQSSDCRIVSKANGTAADDHFWMLSTIDVDDDVRLRFRLKAGEDTTTLIASSGDLGNGNWYHVAGTYDGEYMRVYLDGIEVGAVKAQGPIASDPSVPIWLGANPPDAAARPWNGAIDNVQIWDRAQAGADLQSTAGPADASTAVGLIAQYSFDLGEQIDDRWPLTFGSGEGEDANDPQIDSLVQPDPAPASSLATELASSGPCTFTNPDSPQDDPNEPWDGAQGRYQVSQQPIPVGYPTPLTTGLCGIGIDVDDLTPVDGFTVTENGAVIDGLDINGTLRIEADDVIVRNSRITSPGTFALELAVGFTNLTVTDTRIRGVGENPAAAVRVYGFATFERAHISGGRDILKASEGILVEDSYLAGVYRVTGSHNDVVQIRSGSNYTFRGNTMLGPWQMSNAVFIIQAKAGAGGGDISDVLVEENYLSGGGYMIYTTSPDYDFTNGVVRNNRIEVDSWQYDWQYNPAGASYYGNEVLPSD